jgi:MraZ protein
MAVESEFILGEYQRTLDERFRLTLPVELAERLESDELPCVLVKEQPGCLSLWNATAWRTWHDPAVEVVRSKMRAGTLAGRLVDVQRLGRLLSTRHREAPLAGRSRLLVPEGFREFLGVEPGAEVTIVGAAVCIELWKPTAWLTYLERGMPRFRKLLDRLSQ